MSDQVAATERPLAAVGLCIVSDEAAAVGVTAIPRPYGDAESDFWFTHEFWAAPISRADSTGFAKVDSRVILDSKGMRKMSEDQTIALVIENAATTGGVQFRLDLRILVMVT